MPLVPYYPSDEPSEREPPDIGELVERILTDDEDAAVVGA